jgi:hypothetical protein
MADASCAVLFQDKDHGKTMDRPTMIFFCAPSVAAGAGIAVEFRSSSRTRLLLPIHGS